MIVIDHNVSEPCFFQRSTERLKEEEEQSDPQLRNQEKVSTKLQLT